MARYRFRFDAKGLELDRDESAPPAPAVPAAPIAPSSQGRRLHLKPRAYRARSRTPLQGPIP